MSQSAKVVGFDPVRANAPGAAPSPLAKARFAALIQSPLRRSLISFLHARSGQAFDVETMSQALTQLQADVENCLGQLVTGGLVVQLPGEPPRFTAQTELTSDLRALISEHIQRENGSADSPAVQRFRATIGRDEKMMLVLESIRTVAKTDLAVLVLGPTGSGKEVVARLIHELSRRRSERFQAVNCAALPDTLFESELFGYEKGAFTGAHDRKPGRIELADKGTLFLDEIGDLALHNQAKLLRVVEERRVERLGGRDPRPIDFRLISATHQPLDTYVSERQFREDLYYRVNAFTIRLPALRERPMDIPVLAARFLVRYCESQGLAPDAKTFSQEALTRLMRYPWPGNIRELETTVSRVAVSAAGAVIGEDDVQFLHRSAVDRSGRRAGLLSLREVEAAHIQQVLDQLGWNKKRAAQLLEISRETLYRKIAEYRLTRREAASAPPAPDAENAWPAECA